eukprot:1571125-Pyramimonas_sp.AAC.1
MLLKQRGAFPPWELLGLLRLWGLSWNPSCGLSGPSWEPCAPSSEHLGGLFGHSLGAWGPPGAFPMLVHARRYRRQNRTNNFTCYDTFDPLVGHAGYSWQVLGALWGSLGGMIEARGPRGSQ